MIGRSPAAARFDPPVRKWQGLAPTDLGPAALEAWLCAEAGLDAADWDALLRHQGLWIDRHRWAGQAVSAGARATVYAFTAEPEAPEITEEDILLDLGDVVAVAKPAWLCTQGSRATAALSVEARVAHLLDRPQLIAAHRLDRETSGVLLLSAPGRVAGALHAGFRAATVEKVYHAVVRPPLAAPRDVEGPMRRVLHPSHSQFTLGILGDEGVDSFTAFRPLDAGVVEARPRTGRTHQIRVHLAAIGHPIAGDTLYGPAWAPGDPDRTLLHAFSLAFDHAGRRHRVEAPPPADLRPGSAPAAAAP